MTHKESTVQTALHTSTVIVFALAMLSMQPRSLQNKLTDNFRIRYPKNISSKQVARVSRLLEQAYTEYRTKLGTSFRGKPDVILVSTANQIKQQSKVFDDAAYLDGKIYILPSSLFVNDSCSKQTISPV